MLNYTLFGISDLWLVEILCITDIWNYKYVFVYYPFDVFRIYKSTGFQKGLWVQHDLRPCTHSFHFGWTGFFQVPHNLVSLNWSCWFVSVSCKYFGKRYRLNSQFSWLACLSSIPLYYSCSHTISLFPSWLFLTGNSFPLLNCASIPEEHCKNQIPLKQGHSDTVMSF